MSSSKYRTSCDACLTAKVRCSQAKPSCVRCNQGDQPCKYSPYRRLGRPPKRLAPDASSHPSGHRGASSRNAKESPRLRSRQTIEAHTKEHISHPGVMYQANIRPKTGVHCLKSDNVDALGHLDARSVPRLASAHEWYPEDLRPTEEGLSGSLDLMPEFDIDNLELSASDFLHHRPGFDLLPSISSLGRLSTEIVDSMYPVETITDFGQQSPPALNLESLKSLQHVSFPTSLAYGSHHLPMAARPQAPGDPLDHRPRQTPAAGINVTPALWSS